ncbi:MAG: ABC transporter permease [Bacteroidia bacterium]|nr:ABC transporter permease [Bacteroidia bacterium]
MKPNLLKLKYFKISYKKITGIAILLLFWQIGCTIGWINSKILPDPITVFNALWKLIISGSIITDTLVSLWRVLIGYLIAVLFGISLGYSMAINKNTKDVLSPIIEILRPIPPVAFIPLSILWFGIGNGPAYFLVAFGAFFPIFTNTFQGIASVDKIHLNAANCLGASKKQMVLDVQFPAAMPFITIGLKTGVGVAWFCVIAAELVGAQSGLGYMIQLNRLTLQSEKVIAGMIMIGIVGFLMSRLMLFIQRKLTPWTKNAN